MPVSAHAVSVLGLLEGVRLQQFMEPCLIVFTRFYCSVFRRFQDRFATLLAEPYLLFCTVLIFSACARIDLELSWIPFQNFLLGYTIVISGNSAEIGSYFFGAS